jgi:hypothetical protein
MGHRELYRRCLSMKSWIIIPSLVSFLCTYNCAYGRVFSVFTFPSLSFEHGGRSIGSEVYFYDKFSLGVTWVQNANNRGVAEMKERFVTSEVSYWTGDDSEWNRWRFGVGVGYHWLSPDFRWGFRLAGEHLLLILYSWSPLLLLSTINA